jgi:methylenetetrahydrofolate dehydrogenase (NADP+)/methenyltetrahydrofolate cyclohydrolase
MIIDGRAVAKEILLNVKERASAFAKPPHIIAVVTSDTPATRSYLSIKEKRAVDAGCVLEVLSLPEDTSTSTLCSTILSEVVPKADAIIVQLPLPEGLDTQQVCDTIPLVKDADILSSAARAVFAHAPESLVPPVVGAVRAILEQGSIAVAGKKIAVLGAGFLVGAPVATWCTKQGGQVTIVTKESGDLAGALKDADIIVSGMGVPHLITPSIIKEGVVLIDAGTSESGGAIVGDADPACAEKCTLFTPVPGGVGPIAVALLFENVVALLERTTNS